MSQKSFETFRYSFSLQTLSRLDNADSPLLQPIVTLTNSFIGYILCIVLFMGIYYGNIWRSQDFPFMSQLLYDSASNSTVFSEYNLTQLITPEHQIDQAGLKANGIPYLTGTYVAYLITTNMGCTATIVHMLLWNWADIKAAFFFLHPDSLKKLLQPSFYLFWKNGMSKEDHKKAVLANPDMDPHYKLMVQNDYDEVPNWWYANVLLISFVVGMATIYGVKSDLPWWGFIVANIFAAIFILFFGAQYGLTGFQFNQQPIIQMIAGYLHPGKPLGKFHLLTPLATKTRPN